MGCREREREVNEDNGETEERRRISNLVVLVEDFMPTNWQEVEL